MKHSQYQLINRTLEIILVIPIDHIKTMKKLGLEWQSVLAVEAMEVA